MRQACLGRPEAAREMVDVRRVLRELARSQGGTVGRAAGHARSDAATMISNLADTLVRRRSVRKAQQLVEPVAQTVFEFRTFGLQHSFQISP